MARGQFYLDKANSKLSGVCSGIADYTGVDAVWVRVAAVLLTIFVSFITIPIYIATAMIADKKPSYLYSEAEEERLLRKMRRRNGRSATYSDLSDIDRRVSDVERYYAANTSSNSRLAAEIDSLR
ncbi:phage shock protein C [Novosphingobium sp. PC22D]|uniref:PspC domain-containing protein n=1 Tax=Novosphingobium sp. PC22D TaxID=1962403 RepID=UPI000BEFAB48|nr:PspC domain-containing protein [Novosphingobium sp. PC22D]PEQ14382.1 phage shock protein C [Novosphingobium sp. PC22D]